MVGNKNRVNYVFPILILILTWPLLGGYVFILARTWIWVLAGCVAAFFLCPAYYIQKSVKWILLFLFVLIINYISGDNYYNNLPLIFLEVGLLTFSSAIAYYLLKENRNRATTFVMMESFIIISVIALLTLFLNSIELGVVRKTVEAAYKENDYEFMYNYYRLGMTNYALPHAVPIIIPALVMGIKSKFRNKWARPLLLLFLIVLLCFIFVSGVATAVFLSFFLLLISAWTRGGSAENSRTGLIILSLLILPFIVFDELSLMAIDFIASLTSGEGSIYDRLMEIRLSITGDTQGDLEARMTLYMFSFGEFVESILLGSNEALGGHSALLDRLATLGLIGFIPYLLFILQQLKQTYQLIPLRVRVFYLEGALGGFLMLLSKNMNNWELWLMMFVLMPSMLIQFSKHSKQQMSYTT